MADFHPFAKAVNARLTELSKGELYIVGTPQKEDEDLEVTRARDADKMWETYLAAFPEGTNPIYLNRTEHDCACCRQFIRNFAAVVGIQGHTKKTIWDVSGLEYPYDVVAEKLHHTVMDLDVVSVFRSEEHRYGTEVSHQKLPGGTVKKWNHFYGVVAKAHYTKSPGSECGKLNSVAGVFARGLEELQTIAVKEVLTMIENNLLYRGEEHLQAVKEFAALKTQYDKFKSPVSKANFAWSYLHSTSARFRNTVIGTLVSDISEGEDLEKAVKKFEDKVAPANYKRPKPLITPAMVEDAMKTIRGEGLEESLHRRFAKISDVSFNNVLWVDKSIKGAMKGGIADILMGATVAPKVQLKPETAEIIDINDFMSSVLPRAQTLEIFVGNIHRTNFMSLTAPVDPDAKGLFKWDNNFAWSYAGNIADSDMRKAVAAKGGRVDGVFRFTHQWNYGGRNASLMDLHVFMPGSTAPKADGNHEEYGNHMRVGWNARKHHASGGVQDVDYVDAAPPGYVPVENITFPHLDKMPEGEYICKVHNWRHRPPTESGFKAEIEFEGQVFGYEYTKPLTNKQWVTVAVVTLKDGKFSIDHKLPCGTAPQEIWGIKTEQFVKASTVMFSPNYWDNNKVGNKHWFFILEGCKNDEPTRGIYNEFLGLNLEKHRKVFEVLGDKTKCQPAEEQLSGLGFSSTKRDTLTVRVKGDKLYKLYNIKF